LAFEKALAGALPAGRPGQWFEFLDQNGPGWCCTDLLVPTEHCVVVIEAKLTDTEAGLTQLTQLYLPVVGFCVKKPLLGLTVVKNLTLASDKRRIIRSFGDVFSAPQVPLLQWRGGPML